MASIFCTNCGSQSSNESKFCASCGTPLHVPQPVFETSTDVSAEELTTAVEAPVQVSEEPVDDSVIEATAVIFDEITDAAADSDGTYESDAAVVPEPTVDQPETKTQEPAAADSPPITKTSASSQFSLPQQPILHPTPVQVAPQQWQSQHPGINNRPPESTSPYALMGTWNIVLSVILMNIPVIGLIISIVWAAGGCRKIIRRNLARAYLLLLAIGLVISIISALVIGVFFSDVITEAFEALLPGYTIQWGF